MNKTSTKTLIALLIVLISFIFIVEFTSPIQSINIGHLQKRQDPAPSPDPPKDNPPPPKDNPTPPPPPKENPSPPPPKENPTPDPSPKDNPTPAPQPTPDTPTPNPSPPPPNPSPAPPNPSPAPPNPSPAPPNPSPAAPTPSPPAPNPSPPTPDPNAPQTSPNATSPSPNAPNPDPNATTTGPSSSPNTGVPSISPAVSQSTTTSYLPGREPCTKADDPRCGRKTTDPTVISTTEESEIITQPSTAPAAPTSSQSQLAPNPKKSTITQFTTYTTTQTLYFPGYSTVTSSKGTDGELTTYATYIPPSTVVVVKKVTSAKVEEIQETNPSSAGHLDLELSVYNLYSVATSLFVITVTMLYLIVA